MEERRKLQNLFAACSPDSLEKIKCSFRKSAYFELPYQVSSRQDQSADFFEKIKPMFFQQSLESQYIAELIKSSPLSYFSHAVLMVINHYQQKTAIISKENQEENKHYKLQINSLKQHVSEYINLTEALKDQISQLQQQRLCTETKLNQSQSDLGLTQSERETLQAQRKTLEIVNFNISRNCNQLQKDNFRLNLAIDQLQKKIHSFEAQKNKMICLEEQYQKLQSAHHQATQTIIELKQDLQNSKKKYNEKAQMYQKIVQEFNFKHRCSLNRLSSPSLSRESYGEERRKERDFLQKSNQLNGLVFNLTDSQQMTSKASQVSFCDQVNIIDYESTPYQLSKSPSCGNNRVERQKLQKNSAQVATAKKTNKVEITAIKKQANISQKQSFLKSQMQSQLKALQSHVKQDNKISHFNASSAKKVTSLAKNYNSPNTKNSIENNLKQKLNQKNMHIQKLENELQNFRALYVSQKEDFTLMEGDYQMKLEELKDLLAYTKKELKSLFRKYCNNQLKISVLTQELQLLKKGYAQYCSLLKYKCKLYIFNIIASIEQQYQEIIELYNAKKAEELRNQEVESQREEATHFLLSADQKVQENTISQEDKQKQDSKSLDFQKKQNQGKNNTSQIFVCENLQLQTEFSLKLSFQDHSKGNFTDRTSKTLSNFHQSYQQPKLARILRRLKIQNGVVDQHQQYSKQKDQQCGKQKELQLKICALKSISIKRSKLELWNKEIDTKVQPIKGKLPINRICMIQRLSINKLKLFRKIKQIEITVQPAIRIMSINRIISQHVEPQSKQCKMKSSLFLSFTFSFKTNKTEKAIQTGNISQRTIQTFLITSISNTKRQLAMASFNTLQLAPCKPALSYGKVINECVNFQENKSHLSIQYQNYVSIPDQKLSQFDQSMQTQDISDTKRQLAMASFKILQLAPCKLALSCEKVIDECVNFQKNTRTEDIGFQLKRAILCQKVFEVAIQIEKPFQQHINYVVLKNEDIIKHNYYHIKTQNERIQEIYNSLSKEAQMNEKQLQIEQSQMQQPLLIQSDGKSEQSDDQIRNIFKIKKQTLSVPHFSSNLKLNDENVDKSKQKAQPYVNSGGIDFYAMSKTFESTDPFSTQNEFLQKQNQSFSHQEQQSQANLQIKKQNELQNLDSLQNQQLQFKYPQDYQGISPLISKEQLHFMLSYFPKPKITVVRQQVLVSCLFTKEHKKSASQLLLFIGKQKGNSKKTNKILLSFKYFLNLTAKTFIFLGSCCRHFNSCNFMYGQAQIVVSKSGVLEINRKNKICKLKGDHPDSQYQIQKLYSLTVE